jgi:repressor LexA
MDYIDLSVRQAQILDFIKQEVAEKGYPPTVREIGKAMGLSSPSTVHGHLAKLENKGYIRRDRTKPRAIEVIADTVPDDNDADILFPPSSEREMVDIPVLGRVSAGLPIFAEENIEDTFTLPFDFIQSNNQLFILRVSGESMIEAGIFDGDLLIVEKTPYAQNGQIVVALIDDEATVKTFYKGKDHIRLQPENSSMAPIIVPYADILGRVIALFRHL